MRITGLICLFLLCSAPALLAQKSKPILKVGKDGLPSGHATPEGAACDLARAFIQHNVSLFNSTCIKPFSNGKGRKDYSAFLQQTALSIAADAKKATPSPNGPKTIGIVFAARHLSLNGPASYGYAVYGFKEVEFVDVGVFQQDGKPVLNRTMVIQASDGKWYVFPLPSTEPLLSTGFYTEPNSTREIKEVYTLKAQ